MGSGRPAVRRTFSTMYSWEAPAVEQPVSVSTGADAQSSAHWEESSAHRRRCGRLRSGWAAEKRQTGRGSLYGWARRAGFPFPCCPFDFETSSNHSCTDPPSSSRIPIRKGERPGHASVRPCAVILLHRHIPEPADRARTSAQPRSKESPFSSTPPSTPAPQR